MMRNFRMIAGAFVVIMSAVVVWKLVLLLACASFDLKLRIGACAFLCVSAGVLIGEQR